MPSFSKWTGTATLISLAGREALEIDMLRLVGHGVELHVADQRAGRVRRPTLHLVEPGLPAGAMQFAEHGARVERDQGGRLLAAIDDGGHLARSPGRARRPLTGSLARLGLDL